MRTFLGAQLAKSVSLRSRGLKHWAPRALRWKQIGVDLANKCLPVCAMAPSSGAAGVAADHLEEKIPLSKHGPDPGTTACYLCTAGSTTRTSASSMRRILRRCGHSGRAGDQNHGSVIAFLPEGYVIRKHPGPMSVGCFRCAGCGDQRIVDEVKRIVHSRVRRGLRDMPVGEYMSMEQARLGDCALPLKCSIMLCFGMTWSTSLREAPTAPLRSFQPSSAPSTPCPLTRTRF